MLAVEHATNNTNGLPLFLALLVGSRSRRFSLRIPVQTRQTFRPKNARNAARMLHALGIHRVLLVTSALHMRRALALVRRAGLDAVPVATDFEARREPGVLQWLPSAGALQRSGHAIKETVGWLVGD